VSTSAAWLLDPSIQDGLYLSRSLLKPQGGAVGLSLPSHTLAVRSLTTLHSHATLAPVHQLLERWANSSGTSEAQLAAEGSKVHSRHHTYTSTHTQVSSLAHKSPERPIATIYICLCASLSLPALPPHIPAK
jgi:hypothetical protein